MRTCLAAVRSSKCVMTTSTVCDINYGPEPQPAGPKFPILMDFVQKTFGAAFKNLYSRSLGSPACSKAQPFSTTYEYIVSPPDGLKVHLKDGQPVYL